MNNPCLITETHFVEGLIVTPHSGMRMHVKPVDDERVQVHICHQVGTADSLRELADALLEIADHLAGEAG